MVFKALEKQQQAGIKQFKRMGLSVSDTGIDRTAGNATLLGRTVAVL